LNADLVVKSNAQNISERISKLENALHEYDNEIIKYTKP